ncbi:MAG: T9SS type A sorting domain-containing protein [Actinobacteria bacterium]|nr:T9SS type A sorting domain-containing protein [Actinomycetota bacterium]
MRNNIWFNFAAGNDWNAIGTGEAWTLSYLADAANGNEIVNPMLNGISRAQDNGLDPRPKADGPAYQNLAGYPDVQTAVVRNMTNTLQPTNYLLSQNYPNPFNPTTTIEYNVAEAGNVRLTVYNQLGQQIATLVNGMQNAGTYSVTWDAAELPSGMYFYRLEAGNKVHLRKMMLIK